MEAAVNALLGLLALPKVGLGALFVVAFVSATLLPLGSEPALYGLVRLDASLLWPAIVVATIGNTLGGAVTWWMGRAAARAYATAHETRRVAEATEAGVDAAPAPCDRRDGVPHPRALRWLERWGPRACLLSWLPLVGDPLCAVAGWLRLPFAACVGYMAIGKFLRYLIMTGAALAVWPAA